ncbi:MAG: hypothetical protein IRZ14_19355 [Chloroflexi bacterium]|nr:hypothetical protein [Chloroflexota bacterium]
MATSAATSGYSTQGLIVWPGSTPVVTTAAAGGNTSSAPTGSAGQPVGQSGGTASSTQPGTNLLPVVAGPMGYLPITFQTAQALFYGAAPTSSPQVPATMLTWGSSSSSPGPQASGPTTR